MVNQATSRVPEALTAKQPPTAGAPASATGGDFDDFYRSYRPRLSAILRWNGTPEDEVEDIAQEVMAALYARWEYTGPIEHPMAYLKTAAMRVLERQRARRDRAQLGEHLAVEIVEDTHVTAEFGAVEALSVVVPALAALPQQQRTVMALIMDGYNTREIAACLGINRATVGRHLHEARERLRSRLSHDINGSRAHKAAGRQPS